MTWLVPSSSEAATKKVWGSLIDRAAGGDRPELLDAVVADADVPVVEVDRRVAVAGDRTQTCRLPRAGWWRPRCRDGRARRKRHHSSRRARRRRWAGQNRK